MLRGYFGNLIFGIIARMLCGNYLKPSENKSEKIFPTSIFVWFTPHSSKGGLTSLHQIFSFAITLSYICFKNKLNIPTFVTGILAGLVSITGKLICVDFCS